MTQEHGAEMDASTLAMAGVATSALARPPIDCHLLSCFQAAVSAAASYSYVG